MLKKKFTHFIMTTILVCSFLLPIVAELSICDGKVFARFDEEVLSEENSVEGSTVTEENSKSVEPLDVLEEEKLDSTMDTDELEKTVHDEKQVIESEAVENQEDALNYIQSDESTAIVHTFEEFQLAVRNNTISFISVENDIIAPNAAVVELIRSSSLFVEGNGYTINMRNNIITTNLAVLNGTTGMLEFNNIHFDSDNNDATPTNIRVMEGYSAVNNWIVRFGNITTSPNITRLAINDYGRVELYGENNINTRYENFILSDLETDPGTTYYGNVNLVDVSVLWYRYLGRENDSGGNQGFIIGRDSHVQLGQSQTVGTSYPAVYLNYSQLTVGENATYNVTMPGNAVRLQVPGARMDIKSEAKVNLTSKSRSGSVVAFSRSNTAVKVEKDAEFYIIGNSTRPLVDMSSNDVGTAHAVYTGNTFILDSPKNFDIRNLTQGTESIAVATSVNNTANNQFQIIDSNIDLWDIGLDPLGPSSETFAEVDNFSVTGRGTLQVIDTTEAGLMSFNQNNIRRISGTSQDPSVVFDEDITDAHLNIKARVIMAYVPDNEGADSEGTVNYVPVYASEGQVIGTLIDTFGVRHEDLKTDNNGYISYQSELFNIAGKQVIATDLSRGQWVSEELVETTVKDVTPPVPATLSGPIYEDATNFSGKSEEPNVLVDYTINGAAALENGQDAITSIADGDGNWTLPVLSNSINRGDEIQIFLTDSSGNRNPIQDTAAYDTIFPQATIVTVEDTKIVNPKDPINPDLEIQPENKPDISEEQGLLSIDFVSQFDFGTQNISVKNQTYFAKPQRLLNEDGTVNEQEERPNYIQISDRRGESDRAGWELSVTQGQQFKTSNGKELTGAQIHFDNAELLSAGQQVKPDFVSKAQSLLPGTRYPLITAENEEGQGTWIYRFGDAATGGESVSLEVPKGSNPDADKYSTVLNWQLNAVPANE